jgi:CSLREA domain-containing protein
MALANSSQVRPGRRRVRPVLVKPRCRAAMGTALAGIGLALAVAAPVLGATFTVNSTMDFSDGSCGPAAGACTLREAIEAAVATAGRDTIDFDGAVFVPGPNPVRITLASALPMVADPAGTTVTGAGASVRIDGASTVENGLVFASAAGVPLGRVTVANVTVQGFTHHGIHICGGLPPACDADVNGALVRNVVAVSSGASGIVIEGRVNKRPRVIDSVTFQSGEDGIRLHGSQAMPGARVEGCTASRNGRSGIALPAEQQTGSVIADSFGLKSDNDGIAVTDDGSTIEPEITNVVAYANNNGIRLSNDQLVAPTISNAVASKNAARGIVVGANSGTDVVLTRVTSDSNVSYGIFLDGLGTGAKITGGRVVGNEDFGIHTDAEIDLKVADVIVAANYGGISLSAADSVVERVNSSGNYYGSGVAIVAGDGNAVTDSSTLGNGTYAYGVAIGLGSSGNTVEANVALGNGIDLNDDNDDCDGNVWSENIYLSGNQPCIH